jgi:tetratricopeptide (TPR) repeat protein
VASFYSADFYRLARARLEPNGILSQFVPLPFLTPATFRSLLATFLEVFPQSLLWYNTAELLLIGVNAERVALPAERLSQLAGQPRVQADLRYSHWGGPTHRLNRADVFLAGFLSGPQGLAALAAGAPVERDDRPMLAYASRAARASDLNELAIVAALRPHLEPVDRVLRGALPPDVLAAAAQERERNLADVAASAQLRRADALTVGDAERAGLLEAAARANPDNVRVHRLRGDLALRQQRAAEAQTHYAQALALDPEDGAAHLALARLLLMQGRVAEAVSHYQSALAQRPNDPEAHNDFAAALVQQGDFAGAERHLGIALQLSPAYTPARENLARLRATR